MVTDFTFIRSMKESINKKKTQHSLVEQGTNTTVRRSFPRRNVHACANLWISTEQLYRVSSKTLTASTAAWRGVKTLVEWTLLVRSLNPTCSTYSRAQRMVTLFPRLKTGEVAGLCTLGSGLFIHTGTMGF